MTLQEKAVKMLVDHGMWEKEAIAIIESYLNSQYGKAMKGRMNDDESGYPPNFFIPVWMGVKRVALEWINANKPMHFARAMFVDPQNPA